MLSSVRALSLVTALVSVLSASAQQVKPTFQNTDTGSTCGIANPTAGSCGTFQSYNTNMGSGCTGWTSSGPTQISIKGPSCVGTFSAAGAAFSGMTIGNTYDITFSSTSGSSFYKLGANTAAQYTGSMTYTPTSNNPTVYLYLKGDNTFSITLKTAGPGPSNTRRRRDIAIAQNNLELNAFPDCPARFTRCSVPGASLDAYECVDTSSDLESCGGCPGDGTGVNCDAIPGAVRGAATCRAGQCVVKACKAGWTLSSNSTSNACQRTVKESHRRQKSRNVAQIIRASL